LSISNPFNDSAQPAARDHEDNRPLTKLIIPDHVKSLCENEEPAQSTADLIDPQTFDIMLTDINATVLDQIAAGLFHITNLAVTEEPAKFPVEGRIWGHNHRPVVVLISQYRTRAALKVVFVIDSSSPNTYISQRTREAMTGTSDTTAPFVHLNIHGTEMVASISPPNSHFAEVNVLGADFFKTQFFKSFVVEYDTHTCKVVESGKVKIMGDEDVLYKSSFFIFLASLFQKLVLEKSKLWKALKVLLF